MPRVLVVDNDQEIYWEESVSASDFDAEHFRRCLADRLGWAVTDAESRTLIGGQRSAAIGELARLPRELRDRLAPLGAPSSQSDG